jgi:hypothetical protein
MHHPACVIDGRAYAEVPIFMNEPAFVEDGAPNPRFDWKGFTMAFQKPMTKAKIQQSRQKRRNDEAARAYEERMAPVREKAKRRKATRKAARRKAFAKQVAAEVVKALGKTLG